MLKDHEVVYDNRFYCVWRYSDTKEYIVFSKIKTPSGSTAFLQEVYRSFVKTPRLKAYMGVLK